MTYQRPAVLLILSVVVAGCGTGEYEQRLSRRPTQPKVVLNFNELYAPQALPGVGVSMRVPTLFKDSPLVKDMPADNPVDARRATPMLFELPWLKLTYEGFIDGPDGKKTSYYCYVAAVDKATSGANPEQNWKNELMAKGGTVTEWANFEGQTPEGQKVPWRKIQFTGPQEFYTTSQTGAQQYESMPGVLDIYFREDGNFYELIAWRVPSANEPQVDPSRWAAMMTGCVTLSQ